MIREFLRPEVFDCHF
jgi:hypothetical protein